MLRSALYFCVVFFVPLSLWSLEQQAVYQTSLGPIFTLDQYKVRTAKAYPDLEHKYEVSGETSYKDKKINLVVFKSFGVSKNIKYKQHLFYGEISPNLWKLLSLEAETCSWSKDNFENEKWFCEEIWHPINGVFGDIYLVDRTDLDLEVLSQAIGREVSVFEDLKKTEDNLPRLTDFKNEILKNGFEWIQSDSSWTGFTEDEAPSPAIKIEVFGQVNKKIKFSQTFIYFYDTDKIKLGSVEGEICEYFDRVEKYVCEDVFYPTQYAPLPYTVSKSGVKESEDVKDYIDLETLQKPDLDPVFACGDLKESYQTILKFHFTRNIFQIYETDGFRKALSRLPEVLDSEDLFLNSRTKELFSKINEYPYLLSNKVENVAAEISSGGNRCDFLKDLANELFFELEENLLKTKTFLERLKEHKEFGTQLLLKDEFEIKLWRWVLRKSTGNDIYKISKNATFNIFLGQLEQYTQRVQNYMNDLELLMTAAFLKEDQYTHLIHEKDFLNLSLNTNVNVSDKKYFGVRVLKGLTSHYITDIHPLIEKLHSLKKGSKILTVNDLEADTLSSIEMDRILLSTDKPIKLEVEYKKNRRTVILKADSLDLLQMEYSFTENKSNQIYTLRVKKFSQGLSDRIFQFLKPLIKENRIKGLVLDFQNNDGGDIVEAQLFLSLFINSPNLFYYRLGDRGSAEVFETMSSVESIHLSEELPLIVLQSDNTKSASEIVVSSLKGHRRALTLGGRTFGKFVGQRVFPLNSSKGKTLGLHVTVAEFFDTSGRALNGVGLEPHIKFYDSKPVIKDGNTPGKGITVFDINYDKKMKYLDFLNMEDLAGKAKAFSKTHSILDFAYYAIDQSHEED